MIGQMMNEEKVHVYLRRANKKSRLETQRLTTDPHGHQMEKTCSHLKKYLGWAGALEQ